jgi:hypothetical protein
MRTTKIYDFEKFDRLLNADPEHLHIHIVDSPPGYKIRPLRGESEVQDYVIFIVPHLALRR